MTNILEDAIRTLDRLGVVSVLLPFFLVFTICFAVLQKAEILGKNSKKYNVIVSIVAGMAVVFPRIMAPGSQYDVVPLINQALPWIMVILVAVVALALVVGLSTGKKLEEWPAGIRGLFSIAAIIGIIYIFLVASNPNMMVPYWLQGWLNNTAIVNTIIAVAVFVLIIWFITGSDDKDKGKGKPLEYLGKMFEDK